MNEEQLKEIAILAKELGFKPCTMTTRFSFDEFVGVKSNTSLVTDTCHYLLLCEIQLWVNNTHNLCVSSQFFRSNPQGDSGTIGYFYTIVNHDIEDVSMFLEKYENLLLDCEQDVPGNHIDQEKLTRLMFEDKVCFKTVQDALTEGILEALKLIKNENN